MNNSISLRLPNNILKPLDKLSKITERPRSFLIRKALENYIDEYSEYQIALDRLRDKDDEIISSDDMRKKLGI